MITALDHVALRVSDLPTATEGYRALLGVAPALAGGAALFQFPNMALVLTEGEPEGVSALAFQVTDLDGAAKLASRRGLGGEASGPTVRLNPAATGGLQIVLVPAATRQPSASAADAAISKLDHVVVMTPNADRALAIYGAKLGLDLRLDRENPKWNARQLFFRCGDAVIEMAAKIGGPITDEPDRSGGLAWRVEDPHAAQARIAAAGFDVSEVRVGRKPGTHVFTVRNAPGGVPTIMLSAEPKLETA